jgi:hypothetical protein
MAPLLWELPDEARWPKELPAPDPTVLRAIRQENVAKLLERLTLSVAKRMRRRYSWIAPRRGTVDDRIKDCEGLVDPAEIAFDAIYAALTGTGLDGKGKRHWDSERATLAQYIWGIAYSFLNHRAQRFRKVCSDDNAIGQVVDCDNSNLADKPALSLELADQIRRVLSKNPSFAPVVEFLCDKTVAAQVIAQKHNLPIEKLYKMIHEAKHSLRALLAEWKPGKE